MTDQDYSFKLKSLSKHESSFFMLSRDNSLRKLCIRISSSSHFTNFFTACAIANCVFVALYDPLNPNSERSNASNLADYFFVPIFTLEALIKSIAFGFLFGPESNENKPYLRNLWNVLDFFILLISYPTTFTDSPADGLRALRALRPLRVVAKIPGVHSVISALSKSADMLMNVFWATTFFLLLWSIIGVNLFKGKLRQKCVDTFTGDIMDSEFVGCSLSEDSNGRTCPTGQICMVTSLNPNSGFASFDNVLVAMLVLFQEMTMDNWSNIPYALENVAGQGSAFFIVLSIMFGTWCLINLSLVVVNSAFQSTGQEEQEQNRASKMAHEIEARIQAGIAKHSPAHKDSSESKETKSKLLWQKFRQKVCIVSESRTLNVLTTCAIVANTVIMACARYPSDPQFDALSDTSNNIFNIIFLIEVSIHLIALGFKKFVRNAMLVCDFLVVIVGFLDFIPGNNSLLALRALRLLRIIKFIRLNKNLKKLMRVVMTVLRSLDAVLILLVLMMFIFVILGMNTFGGQMNFPGQDKPRNHFDDLYSSFLTVFVVITGENWSGIMYDGMKAAGWGAFLFFVILFILGNYVFMNIMIAITIEGFDNARTESGNRLESEGDVPTPRTNQTSFLRYVLCCLPLSSKIFPEPKSSSSPSSQFFNAALESSGSSHGGGTSPGVKKLRRKESLHLIFPKNEKPFVDEFNISSLIDGEETEIQQQEQQHVSKIRFFESEIPPIPDRALIGSRLRVRSQSPTSPTSPTNQNHLIAPSIVSRPVTAALGSQDIENQLDIMDVGENKNGPGRRTLAQFLRSGRESEEPEEEDYSTSDEDEDESSEIEVEESDEGEREDQPPTSPTLSILSTSELAQFAKSFVSMVITNALQRFLTELNDQKQMGGTSLGIQSSKEQLFAENGQEGGSRPSTTRVLQDKSGLILVSKQNAEWQAPVQITDPPVLTLPNSVVSFSLALDVVDSGVVDKQTPAAQVRSPRSLKINVDREDVAKIKLGVKMNDDDQMGVVSIDIEGTTASEQDRRASEESGETKNENEKSVERENGEQQRTFKERVDELINHPRFDRVIILFILISCVSFAMSNPLLDNSNPIIQAVYYIDIICTSVFALEIVLRMIPHGPFVILHSAWSFFDFVIVVLSILDLILPTNTAALKTLRVARVLRPLRVIKRFRSLQMTVEALLRSLPSIRDVLIIALIMFIVFGILGVQLFSGRMFSCSDPDISTPQDCVGFFRADPGSELTTPRIWRPSPANFDNLPNAMLTLFRMTTQDNWPDVMFAGIDADTTKFEGPPIRDMNPEFGLYFVAWIFLGSFFLLNIIVGVLMSKYREAEDRRQIVVEETLTHRTHTFPNFERLVKTLGAVLPSRPPPRPRSRTRKFCLAIVSAPKFSTFIFWSVLLNLLTMCLDFYGQPQAVTLASNVLSILFTSIFVIEAILKIIGLHPTVYFRDKWHVADFVVTVVSVVGEVVKFDVNPSMIRISRIFRLVRLFRLTKGLADILWTFFFAVPSFISIMGLMSLVFFMYGVLGMQLFAKVKFQSGITPTVNFQTFQGSLFVLFRVLMIDSWSQLMYDCSVQPPLCEPELDNCGRPVISELFFCSYIFINALILLQLFIAIILEHYDSLINKQVHDVREIDVMKFADAWFFFDPLCTGYLHAREAMDFIRVIPAPLGLGSATSYAEVYDFCRTTPVIEKYGRIHYHHLLSGLTTRAMMPESLHTDSERAAFASALDEAKSQIIGRLPPPPEDDEFVHLDMICAAVVVQAYVRGFLQRLRMWRTRQKSFRKSSKKSKKKSVLNKWKKATQDDSLIDAKEKSV